MSKYIIVSQLDADGVFVGVTRASESPLEPDVYLYPRGTVAAAPPHIPEGFFAKWEGEWVLHPVPALPGEEEEEEPASTPAPPRFVPLDFLNLFTEAEQLAVVQAGLANAAVKLWYDRVLAATYITREDPRVEAGLQALADAGLLTEERKQAVLAAMLESE